MGFSIYFRTTEQISPKLQEEIRVAAQKLENEWSWVYCYGPLLENDNGYLTCDTKISLTPDREDAEDAREPGKPDANVNNFLDCLCALSAQFDIDWEVAHDHSEGMHHYIREGQCDPALRALCESLGEIPDEIRDDMLDEDIEFPEGF